MSCVTGAVRDRVSASSRKDNYLDTIILERPFEAMAYSPAAGIAIQLMNYILKVVSKDLKPAMTYYSGIGAFTLLVEGTGRVPTELR
jgi:hypothetical protein